LFELHAAHGEAAEEAGQHDRASITRPLI
jgi:hypothetical protein